MRLFNRTVMIAGFMVVCSSVYADGFDYTKEDLEGYQPSNELAVPQSTTHKNHNSYARNGKSVYFFGGYEYSHNLWSSSNQTLSNGTVSITYQPSNVYPNGFNGFELGFGKELNRYIDAQFAYLQFLNKTKQGTVQSNSVEMKAKTNGVLGAVAFIFNPDNAFQVSAKLGAFVGENDTSIAVNGSSYYTLSNNTNINPAVGLDCLWNFTPSFGLRFGALYITSLQNSDDSNGNLMGIVALNYTL